MDIKALVDEYGEQGINEIISDLNIRKESSFKCIFNDHDDKNPSMGRIKDSYLFWCQGCQRSYDIINHYQEHYGLSEMEAVNKLKEQLGYDVEVTEEDINNRIQKQESEKKNLEELESIFKFREISLDTLLKNGIKNHSKDGKDIIGVTYYNDKEKASYQWVQVNSLKNRMYGPKDQLFNYHNIEDEKDIIICFDIIDYLTLYEKGYRNICSKSTKGNGFVANYYDKLKKHKTITLIFGSDVSKATFNGIVQRLGIEQVKYKRINEYHTVNHAVVSDVDIKKEIEDAKFIEVKSLTKLEDIKFSDIKQDVMRFGQQGGALSGLDWLLDGVRLSTLTLVFGRDNEGKTALSQQFMCNLIEQGHGIFLYDGESNSGTLKRKFYLKLVGEDDKYTEIKKINIRPIRYPKESVVNALEEWHRNKLIVRGSESDTDIFEDMRLSYKRYGTKVFVLDNMMSILELDKFHRNIAQSIMTEKLKRFCKSLKVSVILIAHANQQNENETLRKMSVSGSKEITDKADNVISFMRDFKERYDTFDGKKLPDNVTNIMDVLKNREFGEFGRFNFQFNKDTGNFDEVVNANGSVEIKKNNYSWQQYLADDVDRNTYEKTELTGKEIDTEELLF